MPHSLPEPNASFRSDIFFSANQQMSEGNGPVNALAQALKATLASMYPALNRVRLADYKVDLLGARTHTPLHQPSDG